MKKPFSYYCKLVREYNEGPQESTWDEAVKQFQEDIKKSIEMDKILKEEERKGNYKDRHIVPKHLKRKTVKKGTRS